MTKERNYLNFNDVSQWLVSPGRDGLPVGVDGPEGPVLGAPVPEEVEDGVLQPRLDPRPPESLEESRVEILLFDSRAGGELG